MNHIKYKNIKITGAATLVVTAALLFLMFAGRASAEEINFRTFVDRNKIGVNETLNFTIAVEGTQQLPNAPQPPKMDNFDVLGRSQSQKMMFDGRSMHTSIYFIYTLAPRAEGKFTIPPASITIGGKTYTSQPIEVEVVKGQAMPKQQQPPTRMAPQLAPQTRDYDVTGNIFFKASANKTNVVVNEPVLVTFGFYRRINLADVAIREMPAFSGFRIEELPESRDTREAMVDGRTYLVDEWKVMLFPSATGKFTISEARLEARVNIFSPPYQLKTDPITINVVDFPTDNRPADFSGAVGKYTMTAGLNTPQIKTNDPVTLTVRITGAGNAASITEPVFNLPQDVDIYESTSTENTYKDANSVSGEKIFEYVLIPRSPGDYAIEPVQFSYYDYTIKNYKTLTSKPLGLKVMGLATPDQAGVTPSPARVITLVNRDINIIKPDAGGPLSRIGLIYKNRVYWALHLLPLLALGAVALRKRRRDLLRSNVALARSELARGTAAKKLRRARKLLNENNQAEFHAEISRAVCSFCADKLNISAGNAVSDEIVARMKEKLGDRLPEEVLCRCLSACDTARFSPIKPTAEDMRAAYDEARDLIDSIERNWKRRV